MSNQPGKGRCPDGLAAGENQPCTPAAAAKPARPTRKEKILTAIARGGVGDGISEARRQAVLRINEGHRKPLVWVIKEDADEDEGLEDDGVDKSLLRRPCPHEPSAFWFLNPDEIPDARDRVRLGKQLDKAQTALTNKRTSNAKRRTASKKRDIERLEKYINWYGEILARRSG